MAKRPKDAGRRLWWCQSLGRGRRDAQCARSVFRARGVGGSAVYAQLVAALVCMAGVGAFATTPAMANPTPWWSLDSVSLPANLAPGSTGALSVTATNLGDAEVNGAGEPVVLRDVLPPGVLATAVVGRVGGVAPQVEGLVAPVNCVVVSGSLVECTYGGSNAQLASYEQIEARITVAVSAGAKAPVSNEVSVSGGGARSVSFKRPLVISAAPTQFGIAAYESGSYNEDGSPDTQAGSHPYGFTTTLDFNRTGAPPFLPALAKDVRVKLPPGLVGNPNALPECSDAQFERNEFGNNECPADSAVGVAVLAIYEPKFLSFGGEPFFTWAVPVFNLKPTVGEPARFGFKALVSLVTLDTSVRTGGDYGVTVSSNNITQIAPLLSSQVTIWGVPGDPIHDHARGWECITRGLWRVFNEKAVGPCNPQAQASPPAFLSLPTSCTGPLQTSVEADSWAASKEVLSFAPSAATQALDGCNRLPFSPSIGVKPDGTAGSTPTGVTVDVHVPQEGTLNADGLAESDPRNITVTLPEGVAVNPAGGDGLQACSEGLVGFTGSQNLQDVPGTSATFTGALPNPLEQGLNFCPDASKIATATIKTPILPHPIEGAVYLATQNQNPFGSLVAMYIVAEDPVSGVLIKLAGEVHLSATGQITTTFQNSPQAPFEDAELHFFGGERAPLATPAHCRENNAEYPGEYTTNASFTPWSGNEAVSSSSSFKITSGPKTPAYPAGSPCPGATLPFSPSLTGGTSNINAGGFSPLVTTISRADGQQNLQQVTLHMPAGLEGLLSNVKLCPEAQANEGTCGPESLIGETVVSAGVGADPVSVTGGKVYLTEKYAGAPFGLSIVNPVKAGPFDLEHDTSNPNNQPPCDCVVVRAKIEVNPTTAELTVTTDPSGPHAIPHLIDGIPVQIKAVNVTVNREHFIFNPTNCSPMSLTGSIGSDEGASSPVSDPFQATNCAVLKYTPTLSVSTAAKASRSNGASLFFKIAYPKGAMGSQSWMKEMKFVIPKQLPARLTTLQKACLAHVFETERQNCPAASIIGHVLVHTPVLPVPLEGPLYFVSYGGAAFPDAVAVLHGYGLTIESHGHTLIKNGVTSATFESVPDVPFESIEVTVPQGPFSEFGANLPHEKYDFCGQHLKLPVVFKAQNGLEVHAETPVGVTGCSTKLALSAHKVKGRNLSLTVYAPAAGKLKASGKGLGTVSKSVGGTETVTLTLHAKRGGRFKTKVTLTFTPTKGRRQSASLPIRI